MFLEILNKIVNFFSYINNELTNSINLIDKIELGVSFGILLVLVISSISLSGNFKKRLRRSNIKKMIAILSSFDLLYYSLEKHFNTWKISKDNTPDPEAEKFWKIVDLTGTVTRMEELKILSKISNKIDLNMEICSLLEFLGDVILISFRGEDLSEKEYYKTTIISSDKFLIKINSLTEKLSREIGIKINKVPEKNDIKKNIKQQYLK